MDKAQTVKLQAALRLARLSDAEHLLHTVEQGIEIERLLQDRDVCKTRGVTSDDL